jgi:uncharacterized protein YndB with AHSA1/START domain
MMVAPSATTPTLEISRTFAAPRERVFRAWTEAESLVRWFAPSDEYAVVVHKLEPRVGGSYRIEMRHSSGKSHSVLGTYRELSPPSKIVFTWRWETDPPESETLVTIELSARGDATELVLRHELFVNEAAMQEHNKGWTGCLARLAATI